MPINNTAPERMGNNNPDKIKLENFADCILYQNQPNPFSNSTVIRFFIPDNFKNVKITFQDNTGKTLKELQIMESGQGSVEVDGSILKTGIYTYSLVVNDKVIDTKKMIKQ